MDVAETIETPQEEPLAPDLSHLITEDDKPVDNRYSERQFTLLSLPLFDSWEQGKLESGASIEMVEKATGLSQEQIESLLALD
jgi:hypothetical protein